MLTKIHPNKKSSSFKNKILISLFAVTTIFNSLSAVTVNSLTLSPESLTLGNDTIAMTLNTPTTYNLLANDTVPTGTVISRIEFTPIVQSQTLTIAGASVLLNENGSVTITPESNFVGKIGFSYDVVTLLGNSKTGFASVNIATVPNSVCQLRPASKVYSYIDNYVHLDPSDFSIVYDYPKEDQGNYINQIFNAKITNNGDKTLYNVIYPVSHKFYMQDRWSFPVDFTYGTGAQTATFSGPTKTWNFPNVLGSLDASTPGAVSILSDIDEYPSGLPWTLRQVNTLPDYTSYLLDPAYNTGATLSPTDLIPVFSLPNIAPGQTIVAKFNFLMERQNATATYEYDLTDAVIGQTESCIPVDSDTISPEIENAAPNNGDANNDSQLDSEQGNVTSAPNAQNANNYVTLETTNNNCNVINKLEFISESSIQTDVQNNYPIGLFDFGLNCLTPGATSTITFILDKIYNTSSWQYKKFNSTTGVYSTVPNVTYGTREVNGVNKTTISFSVTDGGPLDQDGLANGIFLDPSGPSEAGTVTSNGGIISIGANPAVSSTSAASSSSTASIQQSTTISSATIINKNLDAEVKNSANFAKDQDKQGTILLARTGGMSTQTNLTMFTLGVLLILGLFSSRFKVESN